MVTTVINSITTIAITTNIIIILIAINITSVGIVTTNIIIGTIIVRTGSAVICNTAVTSLTITVNIINNNINGLTVFTTGSIAIIIINQTIINITNIAALKNPSTFALGPAAIGYKSI